MDYRVNYRDWHQEIKGIVQSVLGIERFTSYLSTRNRYKRKVCFSVNDVNMIFRTSFVLINGLLVLLSPSIYLGPIPVVCLHVFSSMDSVEQAINEM